GTLLVIDPLDELGDDDVHVGVSLAMRVGGQDERRSVEEHREIGAVIEIETAEKILVRLPAAGVLGEDDSRDGLGDSAAAQNRAIAELLPAGGPLRRRLRNAEHVVPPTFDDILGQFESLAARSSEL